MGMRPPKAIVRPGIMLAATVFAVVALAGCGGYYYRATVQGFVIDDETESGINGATVRIYSGEIDAPDAEGYITQTTTVAQGGSAGYYASTVIWRSWFGDYGREGDTTTIWLAISHPDYAPVVLAADGILSGTDNRLARVRLVPNTFSIPALRGRVQDSNGEGVDGVRVVLELPLISGPEDRTRRVSQTATIDGVPGRFEFASVSWSDANTTETGGQVTATVRVDDTEWGGPDYTGEPDADERNRIVERQIALVPGDQTRTITEPFTVYRLPGTEFSTVVTGRLLERIVDSGGAFVQDRPVPGVRVELHYWRWTDDPDGEPTPAPNRGTDPPFRVYVDTTDLQGSYVFNVRWTDLAPGDFDDADVRSEAEKDPKTDGIPAGEDGLIVGVVYHNAQVGGDTLNFNAANEEFWIHSGARNGVNRLPDVVRSAQ